MRRLPRRSEDSPLREARPGSNGKAEAPSAQEILTYTANGVKKKQGKKEANRAKTKGEHSRPIFLAFSLLFARSGVYNFYTMKNPLHLEIVIQPDKTIKFNVYSIDFGWWSVPVVSFEEITKFVAEMTSDDPDYPALLKYYNALLRGADPS